MRRPGRSNGLLVGVASAILQPVDVWPSGLLPGQAPVRSEVGIAPTSVLSGAGGAATSWNGAATERASSNARHVREVGERDGASFACPRAGRQGGHEVSIDRDGQDEEASPVQGVVVDADDEAVLLEVGGSQVRVPLSEVVRGKVVLPW